MTGGIVIPLVVSRPLSGRWGQWAPKALRLGLSVIVIVGAVVVVLAAVGAVVRSRRGARALRQRVAVAMVPTETFDPSVEEVSRFASQLTRLRPSTHMTPRSALGLRIRLTSVAGGQMAYQIEGPERSRSVLRLAGYGEVELRAATVGDGAGGGRRAGDDPPPVSDSGDNTDDERTQQ